MSAHADPGYGPGRNRIIEWIARARLHTELRTREAFVERDDTRIVLVLAGQIPAGRHSVVYVWQRQLDEIFEGM